MAYRRSISTRVILFSQRLHPSFGYILHNDDNKSPPPAADASRDSQPTTKNFLQPNSNLNSVFAGSGALFRGGGSSSFSFHPGLGSSFCSYSTGAIGGGSDKLEYMGDVAEILTEKSLEAGQAAASQVPVVSEVAIAAADSFPPVAALQYLIDGIHSFTGFNWWASIALTTLMIRLAILPLSINQMRASSKLALMKPELEAVREQMQDMAMDPEAFAVGQKRMKALFKEHGVTPFTPLKGLFIQGPIFISFFMAITNMVEKVPSFKEGGAFWFTDLTTPDALYIFPVLTSLTFLITVECNMQEGMEGNPAAGHMKNFSRLIAVLTIPFTMSFPKAIFCYWVTSNFFSLIYGLVIKRPQVKKFLNLPELPKASPTTTTTTPQSLFSLFSTSKATQQPSSLLAEPSKLADRRIPSSSVMSQRIRSLEKQVKGKKKNKKR
ncbi:Membrane insertase OXA1/ALB3/YidC [Macleaya cordata]|uniref:Membrane insertase OXA1/ALB3/YidC n=1 Tax=Macleaya cordata TaxID=56857 RepID=A0A200Q5L2_MACCD|nr:Membrane insertase OXA1/ALB3/YidC [Macleaya cordata]